MAIFLKDENMDTYNLIYMQALPTFTLAGKLYCFEQQTEGFPFEYLVAVLKRYNPYRVRKAQCDPGRLVNTMQLYATLRYWDRSGLLLPEWSSRKLFLEQQTY